MVDRKLFHLKSRMPVDIEFRDLSYTVAQGGKAVDVVDIIASVVHFRTYSIIGNVLFNIIYDALLYIYNICLIIMTCHCLVLVANKRILKNINGHFKAGQLHAIMGASGSGKTTLLNILASYKLPGTSGTILVNGEPRNVRKFRKFSRYIMQEDALQPLLSVEELMHVAAKLKLSKESSAAERENAVDEVLELLRLKAARYTRTNKLSGGERKRLSIALELLNNPPVIFLDEPTTGLDDLCSLQCVHLLKALAEGGRTVICSIHTPSAKIFNLFDSVYILAEGQCVYHGDVPGLVPYLSNVGLVCPKHYNPADFVIEVSCGEYGDYLEPLTAEANGMFTKNYVSRAKIKKVVDLDDVQTESERPYKETTTCYDTSDRSSFYSQFMVLLLRMFLQMYRDKSYLLLRIVLTVGIGLTVGSMYLGMGEDASMIFFNYGFYFTCVIKFLYIPMMPILLSFPQQVKMVKRESFNKWYRLFPYFCALTISTIPMTLILGALYVSMVYTMSGQPLEMDRILKFYLICMLMALVAESYGLFISANFSMVNSLFIGPVTAVPLMLLAVYGMGMTDHTPIPLLIRIAQQFSFVRYAFEGITVTMTENRAVLKCPDTKEMCYFRKFEDFLRFMGLSDLNYWLDVAALIAMYVFFRFACFYLLRQRLRPNRAFRALHCLLDNIKVNLKMYM